MKGFIEHVQKSIYGPEYYRHVLTQPASYSWKYYLSFAMLVSVIMTILFSIPIVPAANTALNQLSTGLFAYYPDELEVRVVKGHVATNVAEPYFLPLPDFMKEEKYNGEIPLHLGVIDSKAPVTLAQFRSYHSLFWVAENALVMTEQGGTVRITPFGDDANFTVNEPALRGIVASVEPFFKFIPPILVLFIFAALLMTFVITLVYLLFDALLVYFMGKFMKRNWTYVESYRIALHAVTLPVIISAVLSLLLPQGGGNLPALTTVLLLIVVYVNFRIPEKLLPTMVVE